MINFLAFTFKLVFSGTILLLFAYLVKKDKDEIIKISLIGVLSTALIAIVTQLPSDTSSFPIGISIFTVLFITNSLSQNEVFQSRIIFLFSSILGIFIGLGSIVQSFIILIIIYVISQNSILDAFNILSHKENDEVDAEEIKNDREK